MTKVNAILEVPYIEGTPARADHRNGIIYVSKKHFDGLDPVYKDFILAHEEGHLVLNTKNEEQADDYAMKKMLEKGYPLTKILGSLTRVLQYDKANHYGRTSKIFDKLFLYDLAVNKNNKLLNHLNLINMTTPEELNDLYAASYESEYSDFLGLGKKARERRDQKLQLRKEKKQAKNEIRLAKAEEKRAKAEGIRQGTYQPESIGSGIGKALGGVAQAAGSILGIKGGEQAPEDEPIEKSTTAEDNGKNKNTWIIIAIVVILLIVVAYFLFFRKNKK